jgi:hypothetical protein
MEVNRRRDVSGYLKKKKHSKFLRMFGATNLRWYEIHFDTKTISYKNKHNYKNWKHTMNFKEIIDFDNSISPQDEKICDWIYGFKLKTRKREIILFAETEKDFKMWTFAFNLMLKRPEAFEPLRPKIFVRALEIFEKPYLEALQRREREEKRLLKEKEELAKQRKEEERLRQIKEEEERIKREEDRKNRIDQHYIKEEEKENKLFYDKNHRSIIEEATENVLNDLDSGNKSRNLSTNNFNASFTSNNLSKINLNLKVKNKLEDWDIYDDLNQKVAFAEYSEANPITKYKKKSEIDKVPREMKELFKYEQSFVNFQNPSEDVNFIPRSKSVKNQNINKKINLTNKSFNSVNKESTGINNSKTNESNFGELNFVFEGSDYKMSNMKNINVNNTPLKGQSKQRLEINSSVTGMQHENFAGDKAPQTYPKTTKNNKNVIEEINFGDINMIRTANFTNPTSSVNDRTGDRTNLKNSLNNTLESKGDTFITLQNKKINSESERKPNTSNIKNNLNTSRNNSNINELLDFEDELTSYLNKFTSDRQGNVDAKSKSQKLSGNKYIYNEDIKKVSFQTDGKNMNKEINSILDYVNDDESMDHYYNYENKSEINTSPNFKSEPTKMKMEIDHKMPENIVFHKRNVSSHNKKKNNSQNNINNILNGDEIITNITNKIGLKIKSKDEEGMAKNTYQQPKLPEIQIQAIQAPHNSQLPPLYKKKAPPIPSNNKKKNPNFNSNGSNKNSRSSNPVEITIETSKNDKNKKPDIEEEDWFSHRSSKNSTLNNSGADIKSKYLINVPTKIATKSESVDLTKKSNNIFSAFANENSFMHSQHDDDSDNSIHSDFNDSRQIIEQQKVLNKYKQELNVKSVSNIKNISKNEEGKKK